MRRHVAFCLVFCVLAACGGTRERPNVLFVTIDTLRQDAVGADTPAILAFLKGATYFPRTRTVAPITLPAHMSMFTGLFPATNGIHDNVNPPLPERTERPFPLLAEQFRDAGYSTAAFISRSVLKPATGIAGGFDIFDCPKVDQERDDSGGYIPGDERIRAPIAWIEQPPKGKPWFVWVHLFDPHAPYRSFPGDEARAPTRDTDTAAERYAGEARRADAAFEELLRAVGRNTIVVLCSDHGEGLMEHDESTHGALCYGSTLDVVLALRGPGFGQRVDTGLRSVADVAPTLRRLCALPEVPADGRDLAGPQHDTLVSESLVVFAVHGWGQCFAATDGDFTLVETGPRLELFDRRKDPREIEPLPLSHPAYEKLDRAMERFRRGPSATQEGEILGSVSPYGELRRAEAGYLSRNENARLRGAHPHLRTWLSLVTAVPQLVVMGESRRDPAPVSQALRLLDDFEAEAPGSPWTDRQRSVAYATLARVTGDRSYLSEAIRFELASIEKGYVQRESICAALSYIVDASDSDALRTLIRILKRRSLDPESATAMSDAKLALNVQ